MKAVGVPFVKKDAKALVTGKPVYTNDLAPKDCLIVKLLRSPHANAMIQEIKTDVAMRVPGISGAARIYRNCGAAGRLGHMWR